ncbi:acetylcholinesterase/Butyrylcholinesterase [Mycena rebaudengoi]|nr:acetylcholinesterase/Butyrylcholinesterase [Mycena rebaudengoi]
MNSLLLLVSRLLPFLYRGATVVSTSSGEWHGAVVGGVNAFKGVRYAQPPTGELRWEPPVALISTEAQHATAFGPSCLQQIRSPLHQMLFNDPPPASENEDCLFLNVWAPAKKIKTKLPVLFYLHGGGLGFGTASIPLHDGTSIAANQDVVVVTINYRTNVFGFPSSPDIPVSQNNLGFLDQELALKWVQSNIARFGGDPDKVTIMGQSAGGQSIVYALMRTREGKAPFRAAVVLTGPLLATSTTPSFSAFNAFAENLGCIQAHGSGRMDCLRKIPASAIQNFTNGPRSGLFGTPLVDLITAFPFTLERIHSKLSTRVPLIIGEMEDDGSLIAAAVTSIEILLAITGVHATADEVRAQYPGLNDTRVISEAFRDIAARCPSRMLSDATVQAGTSSVFRYSYGAVFADLQKFPGAGAWHGSELGLLFGTYNKSTATAAESTLSSSFQTAMCNFVKDPTSPPAPNWPKYVPGPHGKIAKIAYNGNVEPGNFVESVDSNILDSTCDSLWDARLCTNITSCAQ